MSDFIREVDEDLRQDRVKRALFRYRYLLVGLVVLILGGVAAWKAYDYLATQKAEVAGSQYLAALDLDRDGKTDEAITALQQVQADGTPGYKLLARFRLAGATGTKDPAAGAKMFDDLGSDPAVDPAMQWVAKLRAAVLLLDKLTYPEIKQRLDPLADANSPVRNTARELLALAALKDNQLAEAGRALDAIAADPTTGPAQRQRVEALKGLVRGSGETAPAPAPALAPAAAAPASAGPVPAPDAPAK